MALTYTGSGGIFTRLGLLGGMLDNLFAYQTDGKTKIDAIDDAYASDRDLTTSLIAALPTFDEGASAAAFASLQTLASDTVVRAIFRERPDRSRTLKEALSFLAESMVADSQTVKTCDTNVTVTAASGNVGNGTLTRDFLYAGSVERQNLIAGTSELVCELAGFFTYYDSPSQPAAWSKSWPGGTQVDFGFGFGVGRTTITVGAIATTPDLVELYPQGPRIRIVNGSTPFAVGDRFRIVTANDHGGATNLQTFQRLFDRFFDMRLLGLQLPTAGSPTIADSLIA